MQAFLDFLIAHGDVGMFIAAFLAGTVFPFASEAVLLGLLAAGADGVSLLLWGTAGNVLGGLFNYWIGSLGKEEWIERYAKVKPEKLHSGLEKVRRWGSLAGFLGWVPVLGSVLTVSLGFLRCNLPLSLLFLAIGKFLRYAVIVVAYGAR